MMRGFLNDCCKIELMTSRIYQHFAAQSEFPERLRSTFDILARDEEDHARQFDLAMELPEGLVGSVHRIAWERVAAGLELARSEFHDLHLRRYSPEDALRLALKLEKDFIRIHLDNAVHIADERVRKLFEGLARHDEEHLATLRETIIWWNQQEESSNARHRSG